MKCSKCNRSDYPGFVARIKTCLRISTKCFFHRYIFLAVSVQSRTEGLDTNIDPDCTTGSTSSSRSGSPVPRGGAADDASSSVEICGEKSFSATWAGGNDGAGAQGGGRQAAGTSFWDAQRASSSQTPSQRRASQSQSQLSRAASQSQLPRIVLQTQLVPRAVPRSESVRETRLGSGVDGGALHAALLAVQSDESMSRKGLDRVLSARKRRPLQEDSGTASSEGDVDCGSGGKMVSLQKRASIRRKPLMDERRVSVTVPPPPSPLSMR